MGETNGEEEDRWDMRIGVNGQRVGHGPHPAQAYAGENLF